MLQNNPNYLSVLNNTWAGVPNQITQHRLNKIQVCKHAEQLPQIKAIKQKFPQVNVSLEAHHIKKIKNGIYIGSLNAQQQPDGYGIIKYDDDQVLHAMFRNGKANGKGLILLSKTQYYVGDFVENQFDGRGQYSSPEMTYFGQFRNNKFEGNGQLQTRQNSGKFIGKMEKGQMKYGTLTWEVKSIKNILKYSYKGKFKDNRFQDQHGQLISNAGIYTGSFKNGKKHGEGRFQYSQKYQYVGTYQNDLKNGYGTLYNPQIEIGGAKQKCQYSELEKNISYQGQFKNNLPHGRGKIYQQDTKSLKSAQYLEGIWAQLINKASF